MLPLCNKTLLKQPPAELCAVTVVHSICTGVSLCYLQSPFANLTRCLPHTGTALVSQLLASPAWAHVTTVGRRAGAEPPAEHAAKLTQAVINMDALTTEGAPAFADANVAFCTLGTKRRVAGSAEAYVKARRDSFAPPARLVQSEYRVLDMGHIRFTLAVLYM